MRTDKAIGSRHQHARGVDLRHTISRISCTFRPKVLKTGTKVIALNCKKRRKKKDRPDVRTNTSHCELFCSGQTVATTSATAIPSDTWMKRSHATVQGGRLCGISRTIVRAIPAKR